MAEAKFQVTGHATVLHVTDMATALAHYRDTRPPAAASVVCIFCSGVDALHDDLHERGANISRETTTHPYGMRDFIVTDPDGHQLIFGEGTSTD